MHNLLENGFEAAFTEAMSTIPRLYRIAKCELTDGTFIVLVYSVHKVHVVSANLNNHSNNSVHYIIRIIHSDYTFGYIQISRRPKLNLLRYCQISYSLI